MADRATCKSCGKPILWARLADGAMMPINPGTIDVPAPTLVAYNPQTGGGRVLAEADRAPAREWMASGVTIHFSHWVTCPHAETHRRRDRRFAPPAQESLLDGVEGSPA